MLEIRVFQKKILCWKDVLLSFTEIRRLKVIALKYLNTSGKLLTDSGKLKVSILL